MLVVHGAWRDGQLVLWAEDSRLGEAAVIPAGRGQTAAHPYAGAVAGLFAGEAVTVTMRLPSYRGGPAPSADAQIERAGRTARMGSWTVPAVLVGATDALALLADVDQHAEDDRWRPAASLRYLAVAAGHATDLVRRGRLLPQLVAEHGQHTGRWRAVHTGDDLAALRELTLAMPPVCHAATLHGDPRSAVDTLRSLLDALVDAAARRTFPDRLLRGQQPGAQAALADRWLWSLTGTAQLGEVDPTAADQLRRSLERWFAQAHDADSTARLSFRLIEPEPVDNSVDNLVTSENWQVEFALQAFDDPSLYVTAASVWAGERPVGLPPHPDECLLRGLGRAVRLYPGLDSALREATPTTLTLDSAGAYAFLRDAAPLLRAAGFGVQLPTWAGRRGLGLSLTTRSKSRSAAGSGRAAVNGEVGAAALVDFQLHLMLGDESISEAELAELARLKVPLIRVRGQWVELDDRQLTAALDVLRRRRSGEMTVAEVLREVAAGGDSTLPLLSVDADGVLGELLAGDHHLTPTATPAAMTGTLRPYQERGLSWLSFLSRIGVGGVLADDMGLGKSMSTLSLLVHERTGGQTVPASLLVCPMSLVTNWQKEALKFAPTLRVYVHHGTGREREDLPGTVATHDLVITTYGTATRDVELLAAQQWARVICDEAQAIKNAGTRQARAIRAIPAGTKLALTGTPVENHLAELWSIMEFCNPGLLGPLPQFRRRYQEPIEARGDDVAAAALRRATGPLILRRLKTDKSIIDDLPEKHEMKVWCPLTTEQASLYQAIAEEMLASIEASAGIERRGNVIAAMTTLKQVCNHPAHVLKDGSRLAGRSGKLARLEELATELIADGDKALIFTQYAAFGDLLQPYLEQKLERPVLWLHGGLSKKRRDELVDRFQTDNEPMLFLLSLKAAGTGLNLTAANHVIHFDRWWNPAVEDQATDRAFRIGQRRDVQVRKFLCAGTLEEKIDAMIERKKALAEQVVGTGEEWLTELSTEALRDLFTLDPSAVA